MALSGLSCPKCSGNLIDEATKCFHCQLPIGKKEWQQALDIEYLKAYDKYGTLTFVRYRLLFAIRLKMYAVKRFFRPMRNGFRRLFVRFV